MRGETRETWHGTEDDSCSALRGASCWASPDVGARRRHGDCSTPPTLPKLNLRWTGTSESDKPVKMLMDEKRLVQYSYRPSAMMPQKGRPAQQSKNNDVFSYPFLSFSTRLFSKCKNEGEEVVKSDNLPSHLQRKGVKRAPSPLPSTVSQPTFVMASLPSPNHGNNSNSNNNNHHGNSQSLNSPRRAAAYNNHVTFQQENSKREKQLSLSEKHVRRSLVMGTAKPVDMDYGRSPRYYKQKSLPGHTGTESNGNGNGNVSSNHDWTESGTGILPGLSEANRPTQGDKRDLRNNEVLFVKFRASRRGEYYVHPEWLSETVTVQQLKLSERERDEKSHWFWKKKMDCDDSSRPPLARRCRSVPPSSNAPVSPVNPITWR